MITITKKNIKIIIFKKNIKINKNYIKNIKIILKIINNYKKLNLIILNALNSSINIKGFYKNNIKNLGWWEKIIIIFKNFKIININNFNQSSYGSTNEISKNILKYKKKFIFFKIDYKNLLKILIISLKKIKIKKIFISIGCSMGGLKNFIFQNVYFKKIKFLIIIASSKILKNNKIENKKDYNFLKINKNYNKNFYNFLKIKNLKIIRNNNNIKYLSEYSLKNKKKIIIKKNLNLKFYKKNLFKYLNYKNNVFIKYFKINNYLYILKYNKNRYKKEKIIKKKTFFIIFHNDKKFDKKSSIKTLKIFIKNFLRIYFKIIKSRMGHDSFLINNLKYKKFLNNIKKYFGVIRFELMTT